MKFEFSVPELERMESNPWLTDRERRIFALFYKRGWKIEDIAAEIDVTRSTICRELKRIRSKTMKLI